MPSPIEEAQPTLAVLFCIPDTSDWRRLVVGMVETLSYGRAYDGATGNIKQAQEIGRRIFESMEMCNLETHLESISTSLATIADNTPRLISIADYITWLSNGTGIDFEEIEAFLNVLGVLPGLEIKIDPLKYTLDWIFKSQVLANLYAQSTAQGAIAGALATGLGLDAIETILQAVDTGQNLLKNVLEGGQGALGLLLDMIGTFSGAGGNDSRVLHETLLNVAQSVNVSVDCPTCGQSQGLCGCPDIDGPVLGQPDSSFDPCAEPSLDSIYIKAGANFVADMSIETMVGIANAISSTTGIVRDALTGGGILPLQVTYTAIANQLAAQIPNQVWFNLSASDRQSTIQLILDRVVSMWEDADTQNVPESGSLNNVVLDWTGAMVNMGAWMATGTNRNPVVQLLFDGVANAESLSQLVGYVTDWIDDAATANPGFTDVVDAATIAKGMISNGFVGVMTEQVPQVASYPPSYDPGNLSCCYAFKQLKGSRSGDTLTSVLEDGLYRIEYGLNIDDNNLPCDTDVAHQYSNVSGFTSVGSDSFDLDAGAQQDADFPPAFGEPCGHIVKIKSSTPFSFDLQWGGCV